MCGAKTIEIDNDIVRVLVRHRVASFGEKRCSGKMNSSTSLQVGGTFAMWVEAFAMWAEEHVQCGKYIAWVR